ncbi:MAG: hypothetical protein EPO46_05420, partial [Lysobacter sp.]
MRSKFFVSTLLASAVAIALPAQAQLLGSGSFSGGLTGGLGGSVNSTMGGIGGDARAATDIRADGTINALSRIDAVRQRVAERAQRTAQRVNGAANAAVSRAGDATGSVNGMVETGAQSSSSLDVTRGGVTLENNSSAHGAVDAVGNVTTGLDTARDRASAAGQRGLDIATGMAGDARSAAGGAASATANQVRRGASAAGR